MKPTTEQLREILLNMQQDRAILDAKIVVAKRDYGSALAEDWRNLLREQGIVNGKTVVRAITGEWARQPVIIKSVKVDVWGSVRIWCQNWKNGKRSGLEFPYTTDAIERFEILTNVQQ